jgi:hypothetical protein
MDAVNTMLTDDPDDRPGKIMIKTIDDNDRTVKKIYIYILFTQVPMSV